MEIRIEKGVHQGGCCSSIYFLIIAEILAISLRENQDIDGITWKNIKNLLNQFADDMDVFSLAKEASLRAISKELRDFYYQSGFMVSYDKTTMYRIGSLRFTNSAMYSMDEYKWSNEDIKVLGITISHDDFMEKNYAEIEQKVKKVLTTWYNRDLSLLGKVQVVNTLVESLFVYRMMVLPMIPKTVIKRFENLIREFLWKGKKSKIALSILQNPKQAGGLRLVNLKSKDIALKASWPSILHGEIEYAKMVFELMRCGTLGENIWRCNLAPEDVRRWKKVDSFWQDVVFSWSSFNYYYNMRIENQVIWYNSKIRVGDKPFYWKDAHQNGLFYVYQLFQEGKFKMWPQIAEQFGLTKLRYNSLKTAIPKDWVEFFQSNKTSTFLPLAPHNFDLWINSPRSGWSRRVYNFLLDDAMLLHGKYMKWRQDLGSDFCPGLYDFGLLHLNIYKMTNVTKYRSFQYRVNQRAIVTNVDLCRWGITSSEKCSFCGEEDETILHLLVSCSHVRVLWDQLLEYISKEYTKTALEVNDTNLIFSTLHANKQHVANFLCMLTKQYIYSQRCLKRDLSFHGLLAKIRQVENIEKYIAIKNGKFGQHQRKWCREISTSVQDYVYQYLERT